MSLAVRRQDSLQPCLWGGRSLHTQALLGHESGKPMSDLPLAWAQQAEARALVPSSSLPFPYMALFPPLQSQAPVWAAPSKAPAWPLSCKLAQKIIYSMVAFTPWKGKLKSRRRRWFLRAGRFELPITWQQVVMVSLRSWLLLKETLRMLPVLICCLSVVKLLAECQQHPLWSKL